LAVEVDDAVAELPECSRWAAGDSFISWHKPIAEVDLNRAASVCSPDAFFERNIKDVRAEAWAELLTSDLRPKWSDQKSRVTTNVETRSGRDPHGLKGSISCAS
jgi:hypothetical protein